MLPHTGLAISDEDRELLKKKVNVIFHMAATVRFDNPLGTSVSINVRGTKGPHLNDVRNFF